VSAIELMDRHYAGELGCDAGDLNSGRMVIVGSEKREIRFAKGSPLAVYAIAKASGTVLSVRPRIRDAVNAIVGKMGACELSDTVCDAIEAVVKPLVDVKFWFKGRRLYCEPGSFTDLRSGEVRVVTDYDEHAMMLHQKWGGEVFGQIVDEKVAAWAAVKPLSDVAWDLSIETLPEYRGRGYAKSVVSAAVKYIFENDRLAAWGTDRDNIASLRTAWAVGFVDYALDFGCVESK